jgi:lambda family phage portal protein
MAVTAKKLQMGDSFKVPARAGYMRDNNSPVFLNWQPALRHPSDAVGTAWRSAAARTIDMVQNSGFISGIIDQAVANTVGTGLKLNLSPDFATLGMTEDEGAKWAKRVEARFNIYAKRALECDAEATKSFYHAQASAFRHWLVTGDIISSMPYFWHPGGLAKTKFKLIPSYFLPAKNDERRRLVNGIEQTEMGAPRAYNFCFRDPGSFSEREVRVPARDSLGRPQVVHVFTGDVGQNRGISVFAPVLRVCRQFDQLADATLTAAITQSLFAAVFKSEIPTTEALKAMQAPGEAAKLGASQFDMYQDAVEGWSAGVDIDIGRGGRIPHLMPGDELEFLRSEHPNTVYTNFAKFLLLEMTRCAGMTYESGTGDYLGATYSSVRMATTEIFNITLTRRENVVAPWNQALFENWLEEDIERGLTPFPGGVRGFLENRPAAANATWTGSGKPQADDLKTSKAHAEWDALGIRSHTEMAAELGRDIEDVYMERAREKAMREKLGLPEPVRIGQVDAQLLTAETAGSQVAQ